jgi:hypothetical protein
MRFGLIFGRKISMSIGSALVVVGATIQASSYSMAQICVARAICVIIILSRLSFACSISNIFNLNMGF